MTKERKGWIEYEPIDGSAFVRCPECGRRIRNLRMAMGAHAAWHIRQQAGGLMPRQLAERREAEAKLREVGTREKLILAVPVAEDDDRQTTLFGFPVYASEDLPPGEGIVFGNVINQRTRYNGDT